MTTERATEAECQSTIIQAAKLHGWYVHAERPAVRGSGKWSTPIQGKAGFPDLVLCHPKDFRLLFVELKRKPNTVEADQRDWISALRGAGADVRIVWVPELMDDFIESLARR